MLQIISINKSLEKFDSHAEFKYQWSFEECFLRNVNLLKNLFFIMKKERISLQTVKCCLRTISQHKSKNFA